MSKELLKFVDINGLTTYWNNNKEYVQTKFRKKIFVGTEEEYRLVESYLEEGALVVILDDVPEGYSKFIATNQNFYTIDDMLFCVKE